MKKLLLILLCLPMIGFGQNVYIPDANFKAYLVGNTAINTNGDSEIQVSEATAFSDTINCSSLNISDLTGIEAFTALTDLYCGSNQLTSLDVSNNIALTVLACYSNPLTSLDISQNTALTVLSCIINQLTSLDISNNTALTRLACGGNQLTSLDLSNNTDLDWLDFSYNQLTTLDVSQNTALTSLNCVDNQLTSLNVSQNTALTSLNCVDNQLTSLNVSQNTALTYLWCSNNQLTSLDVSNNTALTYFYCENNLMTALDLSNNPLETFIISNNPNLSNIDLRNGNNLAFFPGGDIATAIENNQQLFCINADLPAYCDSVINTDLQNYFSTNCSGTSIQEHSSSKKLLKVTDLFGRETKQTNQPLFYIYDDGTVEKRIVIE